MKKLFSKLIVLTCIPFLTEAEAQTLGKASADSVSIKNAEFTLGKTTSFYGHFGRDRPSMFVVPVYPGRNYRTGFKNQNMRIVSNRDFRNLNTGIRANALF